MININKRLVNIFILLGVCGCAEIPEKKVLIYRGVVVDEISKNSLANSHVDIIEIDEGREQIRYNNGRIIVQLTNCGNSEWYCISDGSLEFAYPKNRKLGQDSWEHRGVFYKIMGTDDVVDMNRAYFILAEGVSAERNIGSKIFLYSERAGIVGITKLQGHSLIPATYLLDR